MSPLLNDGDVVHAEHGAGEEGEERDDHYSPGSFLPSSPPSSSLPPTHPVPQNQSPEGRAAGDKRKRADDGKRGTTLACGREILILRPKILFTLVENSRPSKREKNPSEISNEQDIRRAVRLYSLFNRVFKSMSLSLVGKLRGKATQIWKAWCEKLLKYMFLMLTDN